MLGELPSSTRSADGKNTVFSIFWFADVSEQRVDELLRSQRGGERFAAIMYSTPPGATVRRLEPDAPALSIGRLFSFQDLDEDGVWDVGAEPILGASMNDFVVYIPEEHDGGQRTPGFRIVPSALCLDDSTSSSLGASDADRTFTVGFGEDVPVGKRIADHDFGCDTERFEQCTRAIDTLEEVEDPKDRSFLFDECTLGQWKLILRDASCNHQRQRLQQARARDASEGELARLELSARGCQAFEDLFLVTF